MQKHRKKRHLGSGFKHNANTRLQEFARNSIKSLAREIEGDEHFAVRHLHDEYLSKFCDESVVPASVRRTAAIEKFLACEAKNRSTNDFWDNYPREYNILPRVSLSKFVRFARRIIRDILGELHDEVVIGSFSGGASTSRRRTESNPALKFTGKADVTEECVKYVDLVLHLCPLLRESSFSQLNIVEGNSLFTVPKKTDIDRCACKEPDINMYLQKGVGNHIRRRLRRFGIDLNDQSRNRELARQGSIDSMLATVDMSSASDLISRNIVKALLPRDWFLYLDDIRSKSTRVNEDTIQLEMFSSMGNGFTFELESLIFYALARTTLYFEGISGTVSVYGDDVIIPSSGFSMFSFVLVKFGFTVNEEKSFHTGFFRESCGGHYYHGEDVTPFYLKRAPKTLTDLIRVCNQLRRWCLASPWRQYEIPNLYLLWKRLASFCPLGLWGGYDLSLDTQLVSDGPPKHKLVRVSAKVELPDIGRYLSWHNSNWNRTRDITDDIAEPVSTNQICRLRRVRLGDSVTRALFREELGS